MSTDPTATAISPARVGGPGVCATAHPFRGVALAAHWPTYRVVARRPSASAESVKRSKALPEEGIHPLLAARMPASRYTGCAPPALDKLSALLGVLLLTLHPRGRACSRLHLQLHHEVLLRPALRLCSALSTSLALASSSEWGCDATKNQAAPDPRGSRIREPARRCRPLRSDLHLEAKRAEFTQRLKTFRPAATVLEQEISKVLCCPADSDARTPRTPSGTGHDTAA